MLAELDDGSTPEMVVFCWVACFVVFVDGLDRVCCLVGGWFVLLDALELYPTNTCFLQHMKKALASTPAS